MTIRRTHLWIALLTSVGAAAACAPPDVGRSDGTAAAFVRIVAAEDARPAGGAALDVLAAATSSPRPSSRTIGVRALGRLENPAMLDLILPLLDDPVASVRSEAANAMAQAVHRGSGEPALRPLLARTEAEHDPQTLGSVARSLGRLRLPSSDVPLVARSLVRLSRPDGYADAEVEQLSGVILGLESLARRHQADVGGMTAARLRELTRYGRAEATQTQAMVRIREIALVALGHTGRLSVFDVEASMRDQGGEVRQAAAARLGIASEGVRPELLRRALLDPSFQVRTEAVRITAAGPADAVACSRLMAVATTDESAMVRIMALDGLDRPCPDRNAQRTLLTVSASNPGPSDGLDWHESSHALVALASIDPGAAQRLLPRHAGHANPFVRAYAAQAAARIRDRSALRALARDASPNVRTAALPTLSALEGRDADSVLLDVLAEASEPQLLLTVSGLLRPTDRREEAAAAALATLDRISEARSQTMRDARVALLTLVGETGDATLVPDLERYLRDYDPAVAELAADVLLEWTGKRYLGSPRGAPPLPLPSAEDIEEMERAVVLLHMERGGTIEIALRPYLAPTNAFRLLNLARSGDLDGLTLHRVVPNFVVQGGSPEANEYAGHHTFTRDELGLDVQWRGTVGLSTRGRDTGDGQIYFNLVDNVRLDHDYTVFGVVTSGMEVVDQVREGDSIARAEVYTAPRQAGLQ